MNESFPLIFICIKHTIFEVSDGMAILKVNPPLKRH